MNITSGQLEKLRAFVEGIQEKGDANYINITEFKVESDGSLCIHVEQYFYFPKEGSKV